MNDIDEEIGNSESHEPEPSTKKATETDENYMTMGMCLGLCLGVAVGQLIFNNLVTGMCVGMCLGLAIGSGIKKKK